nr:hypothetical protein HK105_006706 [Polyrhizophydium stewartii]
MMLQQPEDPVGPYVWFTALVNTFCLARKPKSTLALLGQLALMLKRSTRRRGAAGRTRNENVGNRFIRSSNRGAAEGRKYYAMRISRNPGIYRSWSKARSLIDGCAGARYKSFSTVAEAMAFILEQFPNATFTKNVNGEYIMDDPSAVNEIVAAASLKKDKLRGIVFGALEDSDAAGVPYDSIAAASRLRQLTAAWEADPRSRLPLNPEQQQAFDAIVEGRNVCITGMSTQSWMGVGKAIGTKRQILSKVRKNAALRKAWIDTDALLIEDVSRLSAQLFELIDYISRELRKAPDRPFGGMQVVLCGDFYELPPVLSGAISCPDCGQSHRLGFEKENMTAHQPGAILECINEDCGKLFQNTWTMFAFEAPAWSTDEIIHIDLLRTYMGDTRLATLISELRAGMTTDETSKMLASRAQTMDAVITTETVNITPTEEDASNINMLCISALTTSMAVFEASDTVIKSFDFSSRGQLREGPVDESLVLKRGAMVILLPERHGTQMRPRLGRICGFVAPSPEMQAQISARLARGLEAVRDAMLEWISKHQLLPQVILEPFEEQLAPGAALAGGDLGSGAGPSGGAGPSIEKPDTLTAKKRGRPRTWTVTFKDRLVAWRIQLPLRLAYAVSLDKSAGLVFPRIRLTSAHRWGPGQAHAALYRSATVEGLHLYYMHDSSFEPTHQVVAFMATCGMQPFSTAITSRVLPDTDANEQDSKGHGRGKSKKPVSRIIGRISKRPRTVGVPVESVSFAKLLQSPDIAAPAADEETQSPAGDSKAARFKVATDPNDTPGIADDPRPGHDGSTAGDKAASTHTGSEPKQPPESQATTERVDSSPALGDAARPSQVDPSSLASAESAAGAVEPVQPRAPSSRGRSRGRGAAGAARGTRHRTGGRRAKAAASSSRANSEASAAAAEQASGKRDLSPSHASGIEFHRRKSHRSSSLSPSLSDSALLAASTAKMASEMALQQQSLLPMGLSGLDPSGEPLFTMAGQHIHELHASPGESLGRPSSHICATDADGAALRGKAVRRDRDLQALDASGRSLHGRVSIRESLSGAAASTAAAGEVDMSAKTSSEQLRPSSRSVAQSHVQTQQKRLHKNRGGSISPANAAVRAMMRLPAGSASASSSRGVGPYYQPNPYLQGVSLKKVVSTRALSRGVKATPASSASAMAADVPSRNASSGTSPSAPLVAEHLRPPLHPPTPDHGYIQRLQQQVQGDIFRRRHSFDASMGLGSGGSGASSSSASTSGFGMLVGSSLDPMDLAQMPLAMTLGGQVFPRVQGFAASGSGISGVSDIGDMGDMGDAMILAASPGSSHQRYHQPPLQMAQAQHQGSQQRIEHLQSQMADIGAMGAGFGIPGFAFDMPSWDPDGIAGSGSIATSSASSAGASAAAQTGVSLAMLSPPMPPPAAAGSSPRSPQTSDQM